jgi:exodeoxyribonuclease VII small subunit
MSNAASFEGLYRELEDTIQRLEAGDLGLEESLALYTRAVALAEQCNGMLDRAELRVRQLAAQPDGSLATEPFAGPSTS